MTRIGRNPDTGVMTSITDPGGKTTELGRDLDGNLTVVRTPLGSTTTMSYDAVGRQVSTVEPRGNLPGADPEQYKTVFAYDDGDNLLTQRDPLGHPTSYTHDAVGNVKEVTDAKNRVTRYDYDAADRLISVTAPGGDETAYSYDAVGNLRTRRDGNQHETVYDYDDADRLRSLTSPAGRTWTFAYDKGGRRTTMTDANGNATATTSDGITRYTHDAVDRLTRVTYSGNSVNNASFEYDANGNRTFMSDYYGQRTFTFDALDRPVRDRDALYTYDQSGNLTQRDYSSGIRAQYAFDDDGRLRSVTSGANTTTYGYDAAGNLATTTLPGANGYVETRTYDRAGQLSGLRNAKGSFALADSVISRDDVGNPTSIVQTGATVGTTRYGYDIRDRLTEACYQAAPCTAANSPFIRWTYDAVDNRTSQTRPSGTTTYAYDVDDRLLQAGATTYTYDANGNQKTAGSTGFTYDPANRLSTMTVGRTTTTYTYDGEGLRLSAATGSQSNQVTRYGWDTLAPVPEMIFEKDGTGAALRSYLYGKTRIAMTTAGSSAATFYYHYDDIGSVTNLTSATGVTQWTTAYEPFGGTRTEAKNATKAPTNPMKFTGQYLDPTGLYHQRARQYDTATGRFLTSDPMEAPAGTMHSSAYTYVGGRPTVLVDPSGLCGWVCGLVGAGANTVAYVGGAALTGEDITLGGAAQAAGEGFVQGVTGGYVGKLAMSALKKSKAIRRATKKVVGAGAGGGIGGVVASQAASTVQGCGVVDAGSVLRGFGSGAVGGAAGQHLFPQKGFEISTLRGLVGKGPNTRAVWGAGLMGSAVDATLKGPSATCATGRNAK